MSSRRRQILRYIINYSDEETERRGRGWRGLECHGFGSRFGEVEGWYTVRERGLLPQYTGSSRQK